jgi:putative hemolysin
VSWRSAFAEILGLGKLERLYAGVATGTERPFDVAASILDLRVRDDGGSFSRIPCTGPAVVVANHPTGGMDAILLGRVLFGLRDDVRFLGHSWFRRWPQFASAIITVDPDHPASTENLAGLKAAVRWVRAGGMLVVFPAGSVAHFQWRPWGFTERPWKPGIARMLRMARAPVVPVVLSGRNSWFYQACALLAPGSQRLLLARELLNKQGRTLAMRVLDPWPFERLGDFPDDAGLLEALRAPLVSEHQTLESSGADVEPKN